MNNGARLSLPNLEARGRAGRARRGCTLTPGEGTGYRCSSGRLGGVALRLGRVGEWFIGASLHACDTE